jgi:DNA primase
LIQRYVELKQAGRSWKGLCPFHDEKTPSFNVSPDRGIFHCFGCQEGGDAISFLVKYENLTFPEAVRSLAAELGIEVPETGTREAKSEREGLFGALARAQRFYRSALTSEAGKAAREYLDGRGLDAGTIERFGLGFAPDAWESLTRELDRAGVPRATAATAGLVLEGRSGGYYDRLRGRLTFPICDVRGRVIAFGGRALTPDQEPKYLNTAESPVYHKRRALYGLHLALESMRKAGRAIVCEGYFDAIALHRAGLGESVATCGTALTEDHAKDLRRRTANVTLLFDGDAAGGNAMEKALAVLLPEGLRVRAVSLPGGQDPDDYLAAEGAEALQRLVDHAPDAIEVVIRRALAAGCATPAEKADAVRHVAPFVAAIPNPVERSEYARRLAVATGAAPSAVEDVVRSIGRGAGARVSSDDLTARLAPRSDAGEDRHLRLIAGILARHPGFATDELCAQMHEVLPAGPHKDLILAVADAAADGLVDHEGALDVNACAERLAPESMALLRDVLFDDRLSDPDVPASEVLVHLLGRYVAKDLEAREKELKRRMQEPDADHAALLRERQKLLERKRAAAGLAPGAAP